jgi:hypothetical protein
MNSHTTVTRWLKLLLVVAGTYSIEMSHGQGLPRPFASPSSNEITVSDLQWQDAKDLPKSLSKSKAFKEWMHDLYESDAEWFASTEVDGNKQTHEILLASSWGGSSGRNFLLVSQTKNGHWRKLGAFLGAPIFTLEGPGKPAKLQVYYRNFGDMWLSNYAYSGGGYRIQSESIIPRIFVNECFYRRWQQLNLFFLEPGLEDAKRGCPELINEPSK